VTPQEVLANSADADHAVPAALWRALQSAGEVNPVAPLG
jgi:hypothetical protein